MQIRFILIICWIVLFTACSTGPKRPVPPKKGTAFYHYQQGSKCEQTGRLNEAFQEYNKAIKKDPELWMPYSSRAILWAKKGNRTNAMADLEMALDQLRSQKWDPKLEREKKAAVDSVNFGSRGKVLALLGEYEEAVSVYNEMLQHNPLNHYGRLGRGKVWLAVGEYEKALVDLDKIQKTYRHAQYYYFRSLAYEGLGMMTEALASIQKSVATSVHPSKKAYLMRQGYLQAKTAGTLTSENGNTDISRTRITIYQLSVTPVTVSPRQQFTLNLEYGISDDFIVFDTLPLVFSYSIKKGEQVLFRSRPLTELMPQNKSVKRTVSLKAGNIPGDYEIEVYLKHQNAIKTQKIAFIVR